MGVALITVSAGGLIWPALLLSGHIKALLINCDPLRPQTRCVFVDHCWPAESDLVISSGLRDTAGSLRSCPQESFVQGRTRCSSWEITIASLLRGGVRARSPSPPAPCPLLSPLFYHSGPPLISAPLPPAPFLLHPRPLLVPSSSSHPPFPLSSVFSALPSSSPPLFL